MPLPHRGPLHVLSQVTHLRHCLPWFFHSWDVPLSSFHWLLMYYLWSFSQVFLNRCFSAAFGGSRINHYKWFWSTTSPSPFPSRLYKGEFWFKSLSLVYFRIFFNFGTLRPLLYDSLQIRFLFIHFQFPLFSFLAICLGSPPQLSPFSVHLNREFILFSFYFFVLLIFVAWAWWNFDVSGWGRGWWASVSSLKYSHSKIKLW